jgi:hypothetical protein
MSSATFPSSFPYNGLRLGTKQGKGKTKSREELLCFPFLSFSSLFEQLFGGGISGILRGTRFLDEFSLRASSILRLLLFLLVCSTFHRSVCLGPCLVGIAML